VTVPAPPPVAARRNLIGDAAITLLAEHGMHGLTHRAVDRAAGLPAGSTSYYARTRAALLELVMARMVELQAGDAAPTAGRRGRALDPTDLDAFSAAIAGFLHTAMTTGRVRSLARFEFALEATRRPELRAVYDRAGAWLRAPAEAMLRAAGSPAPARHARALIAWCEGVVFDSTAGVGRERVPSRADLRKDLRELLSGMLGR
jgi:DNA-binding transcriptional regulator YbjK